MLFMGKHHLRVGLTIVVYHKSDTGDAAIGKQALQTGVGTTFTISVGHTSHLSTEEGQVSQLL